MSKKHLFTHVMDAIERRIAAGDYMLKDLPGERRLAEEVGVSYMTARKAVTGLIERGVLARRPNGSLIVNSSQSDSAASVKVALLTPAYPSLHLLQSRDAVSRVAEARRAQFRPVEYVHWYDPTVAEAVAGADGVIVIPSTEPIPAQMLGVFTDPENQVVFLDDDMTDHGIPSVRLFAKAHITKVFEHLWKLGHRRVDCLNVQGHNHEIMRRIDEWQGWLSRRQITGTLIDVPVEPYTDPTATAYRIVQKTLRCKPGTIGSALVCTTQPAAIGAMRACHDAGFAVGHDISVCAINCEPTGRYFVPSLTGLEAPEIMPLVDRCFEWFASSGAPWVGPLLLVPTRASLYVGESTGAPPTPGRRKRVDVSTA